MAGALGVFGSLKAEACGVLTQRQRWLKTSTRKRVRARAFRGMRSSEKGVFCTVAKSTADVLELARLIPLDQTSLHVVAQLVASALQCRRAQLLGLPVHGLPHGLIRSPTERCELCAGRDASP